MYIIKTPNFVQDLFPNFTWRMPADEKVIYLTFDDGPVPEVTPWVLAQLAAHDAKATFFCVGDNVRKHPDIFAQVKAAGHAVGNHTSNHLDGWLTDNMNYFHNVRHCAKEVKSDLFRPPYGRLKPSQVQFLQRHYRIVMWDVLSADFDQSITPEQCLLHVTTKAKAGSIVVFHDSLKAYKNLCHALPRVLEHFAAKGFAFKALEEQRQVSVQPRLQPA